MRCQKCGKPSEVIKVYQFPNEARRRRECTVCGHRFSTSERLWRRIYVEEIKSKPMPKKERKHQQERPRRTYSNFDIVPLEGYEMDYEDVTTYVHVSDE